MFGDCPYGKFGLISTERYMVKKSTSGIWPYAVFAGDGEQQLYCGRFSDCMAVSRKLTGAFLDGGFALLGILAEDFTDSMQPLESIRWWIDAYSNTANGPSYQGHVMVVKMLLEYEELRKALEVGA